MSMPETTIRSADLKPGARLQHANGEIVTLDRRKTRDEDHHGIPYWPGWWLRDGAGGIADFVIDGGDDEPSDWTVL